MVRMTYFDGVKWHLRCGDVEYSGSFVDRLAAYEDTGIAPEDVLTAEEMDAIGEALEELVRYKKAEIKRKLLARETKDVYRRRAEVEKLRGHWETGVAGDTRFAKCGQCGKTFAQWYQHYPYCPWCGTPMTDEAAQMVMERMEEMKKWLTVAM